MKTTFFLLISLAFNAFSQDNLPAGPPQPGWFPTVSPSGATVWTRDGGTLTNVGSSGVITGPIIQSAGTTNSIGSMNVQSNLTINGLTVQGDNPSFDDLKNGSNAVGTVAQIGGPIIQSNTRSNWVGTVNVQSNLWVKPTIINTASAPVTFALTYPGVILKTNATFNLTLTANGSSYPISGDLVWIDVIYYGTNFYVRY